MSNEKKEAGSNKKDTIDVSNTLNTSNSSNTPTITNTPNTLNIDSVSDLNQLQLIAKQNTNDLKRIRRELDECKDKNKVKDLEKQIKDGRSFQYKLIKRKNDLTFEKERKDKEDNRVKRTQVIERVGLTTLYKRKKDILEQLINLSHDVKLAGLECQEADDVELLSKLNNFERMLTASIGALNSVRFFVYDE